MSGSLGGAVGILGMQLRAQRVGDTFSLGLVGCTYVCHYFLCTLIPRHLRAGRASRNTAVTHYARPPEACETKVQDRGSVATCTDPTVPSSGSVWAMGKKQSLKYGEPDAHLWENYHQKC